MRQKCAAEATKGPFARSAARERELALNLLWQAGMRYEALERFRRRLLGRRRTLVRLRKHGLEMERGLATDCEADWEDVAAISTALTTLETLRETERRGLQRIDDSLARMERGTYGSCASCHEPIDEERLRAVPDTDRCARCAPPR